MAKIFLSRQSSPPLHPLQIYGDTVSIKTLGKLKVLNWHIIYCNMITTVALADTAIISHHYHFFFVVTIFKINSLSNFQVYKCDSCSVMSDSAIPWTVAPARLLCQWNSPGNNTGVGCHPLFQGIFPTQGLNLGFLHHRQILYYLSYREEPFKYLIQYY